MMLTIYFKVAWRNISNRRFYTLLHVFGLALSMSCCLLIYTYITYQLSFDTYHTSSNHIFRLVNELHLDKTEYNKGSSIGMLRGLKAEFLEIGKAAVLINRQSFVVGLANDPGRRFKENENVSFTDPEWFNLFSYNWIAGAAVGLNRPNMVVLTQKIAVKYFGDADAMGKVILVAGEPFTVTGVVANPVNTDLRADMFLSISSFEKLNPGMGKDYFTGWGYIMTTHDSFIYLDDVSRKIAIEKKLVSLTDKHLGIDAHKWFTFKLLPLKEMHFDTRYAGTTQKSMLVILVVIGVAILATAGINYVNMVIAQQARRSVEIGTRKILGGSSGQLFVQFIMESVITSAIAIFLSGSLVVMALPWLNSSVFADEPVQLLSYTRLFLFAVVVFMVVIVGAGIYPAYRMSTMNMFQSLAKTAAGGRSGWGSKSLVIVQNVVAQVLISCTLVIALQVRYLRNTDKGFDRESVVMIPAGKPTDLQRQQIQQRMKAVAGVEGLSFCYRSPGNDTRRGATVKFDTRDWEAWPATFAIGDSAYCKTFGIGIRAGRMLLPKTAVPEFLVNETMASRLMPEDPHGVIGKRLWAGDNQGVIVGVTADFNVKSMRTAVDPVVLLQDQYLMNNMAVKLSRQYNAATIDQLESLYKDIFPNEVFTFQFVDEQIQRLYKKESLQQQFITIAAVLAICISSLGILGLISLMTAHRTKEIGIRKVLGASVFQIVSLLSSGFIKIALLAFAIGSSIAWYLMSSWLSNFSYRITLGWWLFAFAGSIAVLITILTVSVQGIRAAIANPVKSLRTA